MNDISGQKCVALLKSVRLQRSLANRLLANTDLSGSMEYVLTWKRLTTPSRRWLFQLVASARLTSEIEYSGWPTPRTQAVRKGGLRKDQEKGHKGNLEEVVHLIPAGWPTPTVSNNAIPQKDRLLKLAASVGTTRNVMTRGEPQNLHERVLTHLGANVSGLSAQMVKDGEFPTLNKEFCRWLQGFPERWSKSAPTATP